MAFTLFCRKFGNVVNRAFLVLIFLVKKLVGANFTRFCNYAMVSFWQIHMLRPLLFLVVLSLTKNSKFTKYQLKKTGLSFMSIRAQ